MKKEHHQNIPEVNYWQWATIFLGGLLLFTQLFNINITIGNTSGNGIQSSSQSSQAQKYSNKGGCGV